MVDDSFDVLRKIDEDSINHFLAMRQKVFEEGELSKKTKLLIALAIDVMKSSVSGVRSLASRALEAGVTWNEISEVLQITNYMGYAGPVWTAIYGLKDLVK